MKNKTHTLLLALTMLLGQLPAWSQTADALVTQGRAALAAHDMPTATLRFSEAVQNSPNHESANFFYGITRLLNSAQTTAGTTFLNQLGVSAGGRSPYDWTATVPEDGAGDPLAPAGVSASAFAGHLRNQILPEVTAAEGNLAKVVTTTFRVSLTANETGGSAVDMDYADVQMLKALLKAFKYWIYTVNSWNANIQLTALKTLAVNHDLNAQALIAANPSLFTLTTTTDQAAARTAFEEFVTFYQNASAAIRGRASQTDLLFQYDAEMSIREENFRQALTELKTSLTAPGTGLTMAPGVTFSLANHFSASSSPRNFLPKFSGDSFLRGTLQDVTFGGIVVGLKRSDIEDFLGDVTKSAPNILSNSFTGDAVSGFTVSLISDIAYNETFTFLTDTAVPFTSPATIPAEASIIGQDAQGNRRVETLFATTPGDTANFIAIKTEDTVTIQGHLYDSFGFPVSGALVRMKGKEDSIYTFTSLDGFYSMTPDKEARLPITAYRLEAVDEFLGTVSTGYRFRNEITDIQFPPPAVTPPAPANDNFANAITLTGFPTATTGSNTGATRQPGEPQHTDIADPFAGRQSVWWNWTAASTGQVQITTAGSNYDTLLGVYTGTSVSSLTKIAANDGHPEDDYQISKVTFTAIVGTTYRIAVDGWRTANGNITLTIQTP